MAYLEQEFKRDIAHPRFVPYVQLHEFEALTFADIGHFAQIFPDNQQATNLAEIINSFPSPEDINNHPDTAPSKRLLQLFPDYSKTRHGSVITNKIGLPLLRQKCRHFDSWLTVLENI